MRHPRPLDHQRRRHRLVANATAGESYRHLSWSPDGNRIVFESTRPQQAGSQDRLEIWVMDADGSNLVRLLLSIAITDASGGHAKSVPNTAFITDFDFK